MDQPPQEPPSLWAIFWEWFVKPAVARRVRPGTYIEVRTYDSTGAYQRDMQAMLRLGWTVDQVTPLVVKRYGLLGKRKQQSIMVTYKKVVPPSQG
jgi:hypothetical protein